MKITVTQDDAAWLNARLEHTMVGYLGMQILPSADESVHGTMPVDERTCQHIRVLHGGASLAFAETLAGIGSTLLAGEEAVCGVQVSGNHTAPALFGETVYGTATLVDGGRTLHVWNVDVRTQDGTLVSTERVVNYLVRYKNGAKLAF